MAKKIQILLSRKQFEELEEARFKIMKDKKVLYEEYLEKEKENTKICLLG